MPRRKTATDRRQVREPGGRPHSHTVRLTDADEALVTAKAKARDVSVARFLAEAAVGASAVNAPMVLGELTRLRGEIRKIGGHTNQLAHAANVGQTPNGRDLAEAVAELDDLTGRWLDVVDEHLAELRE